MKIYFSGAHSVGKSSLAWYASKKYSLPMISETARMILSEQELQIDTLRYDLNVVDQYQQQVFDRQLIEEQKHSAFVSDRSAIDILAYSAQHSRILPELLYSKELEQYIEKLNTNNSCVFFIRPSKATLKEDGVREIINWDGIIAIDAMIKLLFQMYNIRYYQINTDNMQERINFIDNILSLIKTQ